MMGDLTWMLHERVPRPAMRLCRSLTSPMTHGMAERLSSEALARELRMPVRCRLSSWSALLRWRLGPESIYPGELFLFGATMLPFRPNLNKQVVLAGKKPAVPFSLRLDRITNVKSRMQVAASPRFRRRSVLPLWFFNF
ncbi:hypothetical protein N5P37_001391 [Trichoderma harzianum]|nr:hypothetical protein N5P37_001391 [Trichoderma harzianum]